MTVVDSSQKVQIFTDMPNEAYHSERGHRSRSEAARYRGVLGGRAQRHREIYGKSLFGGNSSTKFGTLVDVAFEHECRGVTWQKAIVCPPREVLASDGSRRGKAFTEWRASLQPGTLECSRDDYENVADIMASLREHRAADLLMAKCEESQYSVFWTDDNGHARKARADGVTSHGWFDLKTTSAEWSDLKYSFKRFAYDWQAAWYTDASIAAGNESPWKFPFIVVQVFPPFDVAVFTLPDEVVDHARSEIALTLDIMKSRLETGKFVEESYHEVRELDWFRS
jgi:hypothetical protein